MSEPRLRTLRKENRSTTNPFLENVLRDNNVYTERKDVYEDVDLIVKETGLEFTKALPNGDHKYSWVDKSEFIKVFRGDHLKMISNLSTPATKLFYCILENLRKDNDIVIVPHSVYEEYSGSRSKSVYNQAVNELEDNQVIRQTLSPGAYFINPGFFFNGKRTTILPSAKIAHLTNNNPRIKNTSLYNNF